ncbi:MAG: ABC transporter ATP-binding protein [Lentisphaerota bacterium]
MRNVAPEAGPAVIRLSGVSAGYRGLPVLTDVSLEIREGECWGLIGPNGAGKTTLLRLISGVLPRLRGGLMLQGKDVLKINRNEWSTLAAFVPSSLEVPVALTVLELVSMGRIPYLTGWQGFSLADRAAVARGLDLTGLAGYEDRYLDELSSGERQRAMVAMALAQEPRILLLDEPTAHLDIHHAWQLMEMILRLKETRGMTVVFSSHDLNLSAEFASHLLLLSQGEVRAAGKTGEVFQETSLSKVYDYPLKVEASPDGSNRWIRPVRMKNSS